MLLGTRPEEQDVGPKATDIMSGVFEVFVNLTQVLAGDPIINGNYMFEKVNVTVTVIVNFTVFRKDGYYPIRAVE